MKIFNSSCYGLAESIFRSGYPMKTEIADFTDVAKELLEIDFAIADKNYDNPHIKRAIKLANAGAGHSNWLKGVVVQMDVEAPQYVWMQIERYQFFTIISSQSKMHRLTQMDTDIIPNVCDSASNIVQAYKGHFECGECDTDELMANVPMGLELTAGISTNYLCLQNMMRQRKNHRLKFWNTVFVDWIHTLPLSILITGEE